MEFASSCHRPRVLANTSTAPLLSDLTNVVTIAACADNEYMKWTDLGISLGTNAIGHGDGENGKSSDERLVEIWKFHVEQLSALVKNLDAVRDGEGTFRDNILIVYMSDLSKRHSLSHAFCF